MPVYLRYFRKYSHRIEGFGFLGLSKGILDNILTGERDLDFNLKLTKAIVIEIYLCMIKNNYIWNMGIISWNAIKNINF